MLQENDFTRVSQFFTNADPAAATSQFPSPKYAHESEAGACSRLMGGRPPLLAGTDGKLCTQTAKDIPAMGVATQAN